MNIINRVALSIEARLQNYQSKNFSKTKMGSKLKLYKNKHIGERCFIIGNGPSLNIEDLNLLHSNNEVTFGMNRIYNIFNDTKWRPTYYCCEDPLIIKDKQKEVNEIEVDGKFIPINLKWYHDIDINDAVYFYMNYDRNNEEEYSFSTDISKQINCRGTVTFTCMQLAVYMGFKEIYLLGIDHNFAKIINNNGEIVVDDSVKDYFCEGYDEDIKDEVVHDMRNNTLIYKDAKCFCDNYGNATIYNATRGGKLEVFEMVDFDSLFVEELKV